MADVAEKTILAHGPHQKHKPILYTPVTRLADHWFTHSTTKCGRFEEAMFACGMQGSRDQMYKKCRRELEDLHECLFQTKQTARYIAIQKERVRQQKFEEPPAKGIFLHEPSPYPKIGKY